MQKAEFGGILLPAQALISAKLPDFLLAKCAASFFLCLQHESQPLLGATVQPRAQPTHGKTHHEDM